MAATDPDEKPLPKVTAKQVSKQIKHIASSVHNVWAMSSRDFNALKSKQIPNRTGLVSRLTQVFSILVPYLENKNVELRQERAAALAQAQRNAQQMASRGQTPSAHADKLGPQIFANRMTIHILSVPALVPIVAECVTKYLETKQDQLYLQPGGLWLDQCVHYLRQNEVENVNFDIYLDMPENVEIAAQQPQAYAPAQAGQYVQPAQTAQTVQTPQAGQNRMIAQQQQQHQALIQINGQQQDYTQNNQNNSTKIIASQAMEEVRSETYENVSGSASGASGAIGNVVEANQTIVVTSALVFVFGVTLASGYSREAFFESDACMYLFHLCVSSCIGCSFFATIVLSGTAFNMQRSLGYGGVDNNDAKLQIASSSKGRYVAKWMFFCSFVLMLAALAMLFFDGLSIDLAFINTIILIVFASLTVYAALRW